MNKSLKSFVHLTSFELNRLFKFLLTLIGVTVISNLVGFILLPMQYTNRINQFVVQENSSTQQALEQFDYFSFDRVTHSFWVIGPVALGIIAFLFYSFFIWYREWFGKNTFAYRLLMLPISRIHIYFSKLLIIFVGIFSLVSIQLISLYIGYQIGQAIVPTEFLQATTFIQMLYSQVTFHYVLPIESGMFFYAIGIGVVFLLVLFTMILMERSFSIKGVVMGMAYGLIALIITLAPFALGNILNNRYILYDSELAILVSILLLMIGVVSIVVSRYLLNHKVTI
ncbi:hypothetical protein GCM10008932_23700 [Alkalibacterium iburiense]|uniref:ABC transporter permease n=1 Tax=Alkalibacterium iburiense TaxID=290589 RepID=A0ABN0XSG7_9LACT